MIHLRSTEKGSRSFKTDNLLSPAEDRIPSVPAIGRSSVLTTAGQVFIRQILTHNEYDREKWKQDQWFRNTNA